MTIFSTPIEQIFGDGPESVYLYYFPTQRAGRAHWPCKIGKAKNDPIKRIMQQQASMQEAPHIGLLIKSQCSAYDEMIIHQALRSRKLDTHGKEWFETNPSQALTLFQNAKDDLTLGQQIRLRRIAQRMTQAQLAQTAGLRQATVSAVERGENVEWNSLREILRELRATVRVVDLE